MFSVQRYMSNNVVMGFEEPPSIEKNHNEDFSNKTQSRLLMRFCKHDKAAESNRQHVIEMSPFHSALKGR